MPASSPLPFAVAAERALAGFRCAGAAHRNCAQTVMAFAALRLGLPPEVSDVARYLGGGIARQGLTCGVLTGTALACALKPPTEPAVDREHVPHATDVQEELQRLIREFAAEFGGTDCRTLTGCDLSTPDGLASFRMSAARDRCEDMLQWAFGRVDSCLQKWV